MEDKKFLRVVKKAIKGDKEAFNQVMQMRSRNILYIAISIMHDRQKSEDIAQEAALLMQRGIVNLKSAHAFDSWMYRTVYNVCLDEMKKMKRAPIKIELDTQVEDGVFESREEFLPEYYVSNEEKRSELITAISKLPEKYRMCVLLFYYEDMSYSEIADVLATSMNDITYRLRTARKVLRQELIINSPEEAPGLSTAKAPAALIATPVITQVLYLDEQGVVTPSMVDRFVSFVASGSAASVTASATATASVGTSAIAKVLSGTFITGVTVVTSVMAAAALAVGAYSYSTVGAPEVLPADTSAATEETVEYVGDPTIEFMSLHGTDNAMGVTAITFNDAQSTLESLFWTITSTENDEVLISGEGNNITFGSGLETLASGEYRVTFIATDIHGAQAQSQRNFTIEK